MRLRFHLSSQLFKSLSELKQHSKANSNWAWARNSNSMKGKILPNSSNVQSRTNKSTSPTENSKEKNPRVVFIQLLLLHQVAIYTQLDSFEHSLLVQMGCNEI